MNARRLAAMVNIDTVDTRRFATIARRWLDRLATVVFAETWERLHRGDRALDAAMTITPHENGPIETTGFSPQRWTAALEALHRPAETVGFSASGGPFSVSAEVHHSGRLGGRLVAAAAYDPGDDLPRRLVECLVAVLDDADPAFGHLADDNGDTRQTTLDNVLRRPFDDSILAAREVLRGYSWVTVVPKELVARLGGLDAAAASGAVARVHPLAAGGAVVQATDTPAGYDDAAMHRLFNLLAPVLPPGKATRLPWVHDHLRFVEEDAANLR